MKQKVSLGFRVPCPAFELKILNVYQAADKLIAVSELVERHVISVAMISNAHDEIEVDVPDATEALPVSHFVIEERPGWWSENKEFTTIKNQNEIADLIKNTRCLYETERLEIEKPQSISMPKQPLEEKAADKVEKVENTPEKEQQKSTFWSNNKLKIGVGLVGLFAAYKLSGINLCKTEQLNSIFKP